MKAQDVQIDNRESIKHRYQEVLKKIASDQKLAEEVLQRSFLGMLFSNGTRDLAKASIRQNELISELHAVIQDALILIDRNQMQMEDLIGSVDVLRNSHEKVVKDFADKFKGVFGVIKEEIFPHIKKEEVFNVIQDWNNHVDARESSFLKSTPHLCLLQIACSCLDALRRNSIRLKDIEDKPVGEYLCTAWKKLGMDAQVEYTVDEFLSGLYKDVTKIGRNEFKKTVSLNLDGERIPPEEIEKNVTDLPGYSAICQFWIMVEDERVQALYKNLMASTTAKNKKKPQEAFLTTILEKISNGDVKYNAETLSKEIIIGSLRAVEAFRKKEDNVDAKRDCVEVDSRIEDENAEVAGVGESTATRSAGFDIEDIVGDHIALSDHDFLETKPTNDEKVIYVESFALVFAALGGYRVSHYLASVAKLFGVAESLKNMEALTRNPKKISVQNILNALSFDKRKYAWCVDAMFVGEEDGKPNPKVKDAILKMCKVFGFKSNELADFLDNVETLALGNDSSALFAAIKGINPRSAAWRSVIDFKRVSLKGVFKELRESLAKKSYEASKLGFEVVNASGDMVSSPCSYTLGDENVVQRAVINLMRSSHIAKFKELKTKIETFESTIKPIISEANSILGLFKTKKIYVANSISSIEADEASGIGNEQWADNMNAAFDKLGNHADEISNVLNGLEAQLSLYEQGRYFESAEENAKKAREKMEAKKAAEKETMRLAKVEQDGVCKAVRMDFEKTRDLPFDFSKARGCAVFNNHWLLVVGDACWVSDDGRAWQKVDLPIKLGYRYQINVVDSTVIVWSGYEREFAYSKTGVFWSKGEFPENGSVKGVFFYKGKWLLQFEKSIKYTYTKDGIFWDSKETASCESTEFYSAGSLDGEWSKDGALDSRTGCYIPEGCVFIVGNELLAIKTMSASYADNCHIKDVKPQLCYTNGSTWKSASVKGDFGRVSHPQAKFLKIENGMLFSLNDCGIWFSEDNHNWTKVGDYESGYGFYSVGDLACAIGYGTHGPTVYFTADGRNFSPIVIDHKPFVVAFKGDASVVVDTDSNTGGLFIAKVVKCK